MPNSSCTKVFLAKKNPWKLDYVCKVEEYIKASLYYIPWLGNILEIMHKILVTLIQHLISKTYDY